MRTMHVGEWNNSDVRMDFLCTMIKYMYMYMYMYMHTIF